MVASETTHVQIMERAIALARSNGLYPFAAVIVERATGRILAEGVNRSAVNPVMHAEIDAICRLAAVRPGGGWGDVALYTTAEPCPMCQSAIAWSGIPIVYFGTSIAGLQAQGWNQIDIAAAEVARRTPFHHTALQGGLCGEACDRLFAEAARLREASRPRGGDVRDDPAGDSA